MASHERLYPLDEPIYAAADCDDDPFYQGSDDEDYPDPQTRQLRYEDAARRFLDGKAPVLLSASLRGPFEKHSGWTNPWRSKQRCDPGRASQFICESVHENTAKAPQLASDDLDCHLPSPESLKQAPASGSHPYLEQDELAMVQDWRQNIHVPSLTQDSFWSSNTRLGASTSKRRAKESAWLKRVADKRRKTNHGGMDTSSPIPASSQPEPCSSPVARIHAPVAPRGPPIRSPGRGIGSARENPTLCSSQVKHADEDDELGNSTPSNALSSVPRRTPTKKRSSPRQRGSRSAVSRVDDISDELSQNQAAAATLSSPVSQRHGKSPQSATKAEAVPTQKSPLRRIVPKSEGQDHDEADMDEDSELDDESAVDPDEILAPFQTQQDHSFCFKMRCPLEEHALDEVADEALPDRPASPEPQTGASLQASDGPSHTVNERGSAGHPSDASDDGDTESTASSADADEHEALHQCPKDEDQAQTSLDAPEVEQPVAREDVQEHLTEAAQSATDTPPGPSGSVPCLRTPELEEGAACLSRPVSPDSAPASTSVCQDEAPQGNGATILPIGRDDTEPGRPPATATPQSIKHEASLAPLGAEPNSSVGPQLGSQEAEAPSQSQNSQTREQPSQRTRSDFSIKGIISKLAPLSPWSKRSQPTPSPLPSQASPSRIDDMDSKTRPQSYERCASTTPGRVSEPTGVVPHPSAPEDAHEGDPSDGMAELGAAAVYAGPEQSCDAVEQEADADMELYDSGADGEPDTSLIAASQQSPWARPEPTQDEAWARSSAASLSQLPVSPLRNPADNSQPTVRPEAQSPWSHDAMEVNASPARGDGILPQHQPQLRPSTPEPQFAYKTFASFLSPSPERSRAHRGRRLARVSDSALPSALKNPWSCSRAADRRVSWASMPQQELERAPDDDAAAPTPEAPTPASPSPLRHKTRQVSPPPSTMFQDLPFADQMRYREHFFAMTGRCIGPRPRLIPSASQLVRESPDLQGMAACFLAADEDAADAGSHTDTDSDDSDEPMELAEDMLREIADHVESCDVDAQLERARREALPGTDRPGLKSQSPW